MKYIKGLDSIRTFAVIFVILAHWGPAGFNNPTIKFIWTLLIPSGKFGVDVFFVLSGYLITNILLTARAESDNKNIIIKNFIIRRALRIFPIYYLLLGVLYLINYPDIKENIWYFGTYTSNFLSYSQRAWNSFSHTWSLAVEEQFYLIWPWVIIYAPKTYLKKSIIFFIILGISCSLLTEAVYGGWAKILTFNCFNAFGIGGLLAYFQQIGDNSFKKLLNILLPVSIVIYFLNKFGLIPFLSIRTIHSIIAVSLINYISENKYNYLALKIFENRFLIHLGKITYGIYLYHYIIPDLYKYIKTFLTSTFSIPNSINSLLNNYYVSYILMLSILYLISLASYHLIEIKLLKLKKYFEYKEQPINHPEVRSA